MQGYIPPGSLSSPAGEPFPLSAKWTPIKSTVPQLELCRIPLVLAPKQGSVLGISYPRRKINKPMAALSCNPIPLGFSCQPFTQLGPGLYGNCSVTLRFVIGIILPPGCSEGTARSEGPLLAPEGHSSRREEARRLLFVPKTWVGFEEMKARCFAFWRKCSCIWATGLEADVFL